MIPAELMRLNQWVCVENGSKVPMRGFEYKPASSSDPKTWCDFETAIMSVEAGYYNGIGFVFANNGIIGIDIDAGYNDEGFLSSLAVDIIKRCGSYTEKSRSGRGFHILVRGKLPFDGKNNRNGVEIYQAGRYFIMSGKTMFHTEIIENQAAIDYILGQYFPETARESGNGNPNRIYTPKWDKPVKGHVKLRPVYPLIPNGCRNICLTSLAGLMHNIGYDKKAILNELMYANETACQPMLPKSELRTIVNSVSRYKR